MKSLNRIFRVLALLFGAAALFLFFTGFANVVSEGTTYHLAGSQLAFGGKIGDAGVTLPRSARILFCFLLTVIGVVCSGFTFRKSSKGSKYSACAFSLVAAVYMLVIRLSNTARFVDTHTLSDVTSVTYTASVWLVTIALFLFFAFSVAHLLLDDYIEVANSKGAKLTIPKKIVRFLRDYKSETKKIVWPSFKEVIKNTVIVLIVSAIVGVFVWLVDFGLVELLNLIWKA